jgi:hypothetical protein
MRPRTLTPISTEHLDAGQYVNEELVGEFRDLLMARDGVPVWEVLAQLRTSTQSLPEPAQTHESRPMIGRRSPLASRR